MLQGRESGVIASEPPCKFAPQPTSSTDTYSCDPSGRCTRENCKYLHPPPHLKTQLEINGRNTLATQKMLQNLQNQQLQQVVGMHNMANLQLQPSPASTLLQGSPTLPTGPGSNPVVIPTSQVSGKDTNSVPTASAASFYQHASPQMYSGLQILTQPSYSLPTVGQGASPYHTSQASTDTNAVYSPYIFPVAVTMAPTMTGGSHSAAGTYSPYMMPFSQSGAFTGLGGVTASPMGLMQDFAGLQTPVIPGHTGPSFPILPTIKPKNDKLENLTGLVPPPTKKSHTTAGTVAGQGTGPMMNLFPQPPIPYHHHLNQAMLHSHQPTPVVPTPFPVMPSMATGPPGPSIPLFAPHIMPTQVQTTRHPQSNETIPVCRDFKSGSCKRPSCKYAHVTEDYVEIIDGKVTLCRYAVQNRCTRQRCKFYHPPTSSTLATMMTPVPLPTIPATGISSI